jgi:hypothetical protein
MLTGHLSLRVNLPKWSSSSKDNLSTPNRFMFGVIYKFDV